jgi:predicted 3-demethylubiquinone-9 3-methyltransferase (glyoxalase superfamily)
MNTIATHLWYDTQAEEAAKFYTELLPDSSIESVSRSPLDMEGIKAGQVLQVSLTLQGQRFIFLNGGPLFPFNSQVSIYVRCDDQAEVDKYWNAFLKAGGKEVQCGWLTDQFGLSWQIIPKQLEELMSDPDPAKAKRVAEAMLKMIKIDVSELEKAAADTA